MKDTEKRRLELVKSVKREKRRNYIILYSVTAAIWGVLMIVSLTNGFFTGKGFIVDVVQNLVGILPPLLLFDFFNEKLSRDANAIEMSTKITETLMSNPETLELFTDEQRKDFIKSTIASIVKDEDATEMINDNLNNYLYANTNYRLRTSFDYNFELDETLPIAYTPILADRSAYFYVQEKLHYKIKFLSQQANNIRSNRIKIGFAFNNNCLDTALRESKTTDVWNNCFFRESLDLCPEDVENFKKAVSDLEGFQKVFKLDVQVDRFKGTLEKVHVCNEGIVCTILSDHDIQAMEHTIRLIFHMPKRWGSILEIALVDPVKAPRIFVSYPEDSMSVDMFSFLSKGEESSLEMAHEHLNGIYDITMNSEWVYPISGMVFQVDKKQKEDSSPLCMPDTED